MQHDAEPLGMRRRRHPLLREATRDRHDALERVVDSKHYFDNQPAYIDYLRRMRLFHSTFEASAGAGLLPALERWKIADCAHWLDQDLAALGSWRLPQSAAASFRKPCCSDARSMTGALYVLLGSTLGARLLTKRLAALELPASGGSTYLTGLSRLSIWPEFLGVLEAEPASADPAIRYGAISTFESITDHMAGPLPV